MNISIPKRRYFPWYLVFLNPIDVRDGCIIALSMHEGDPKFCIWKESVDI